MTATTTTGRPETRTAPRKSKPARTHYADRDDLSLAFEMGVQVRMYCGFWKFPAAPAGLLRPVKRTVDFRPAVDCKRCMAVARRMARERGIA